MKNGRNHGETGEKSEKGRHRGFHYSDGAKQAEYDPDSLCLSGKRRFVQAGTAAAILVAAIGFCAANPVLAKELPLIGGVIERVQELLGFQEIPAEEIVTLEQTEPEQRESGIAEKEGTVDTDGGNAGISSMENSTETAEPMCYQASDQGYTITLTDYYATNQAIFLGVKIESENGFPEMSSSGDGESEIMVATLEEYSFRSGDPVHGGRPIRGQLVDEHTFLGMLRIDYKSIQTGDQGYYEEIPEEMTLQLEIPYFFLYPKGASEETVHGSWKFPEISVSQSDNGMQVIEINETNAAGFGLEKIEVSPVELTVYDISPEDHLVMTVVLDKEGRKLAYAGNNANELITSGYDISEITVYLYDYEEYMEIKGLAFKDLTAFRDTLEKNALYEKKIPLEIDKP